MMQAIPLSPVADATPYLDGGEIVAFGIGPEGNPYLVIARKPLDYRKTHPNGVRSSKTVPDVPQEYRVLSFADGAVVIDVTISGAEFNVHHIQPVDGGLLLVCARSFYRGPNDFERNGHLFDLDGKHIRSILLGDGIQSVQATRSGVIWTSFFDEGIFGNYGWNGPVGADGLLAWNSQGQELFHFAPTPGLDSICDCYALNVESEEVTWCYYYTEFPLVRIRNFTIDHYWQAPIAGSDAFAIGSDHVLFRGGYGDRDHYFLYTLIENRELTLQHQFDVCTPDGEALTTVLAQGRGDCLWLLNGACLYRFRIAEALANSGG